MLYALVNTTLSAGPTLGIYIDLDGTVAVQFVIFWAVLFFLYFTVVKPYLKTVEWRAEGIGGSKDDAAEMEERAEDLMDEYDQKLRQARRDAQEMRETLRNQGVQRQREMVEEVREEVTGKIEGEREKIQSRVDEARSNLEQRSRELASTMVEKILAGT